MLGRFRNALYNVIGDIDPATNGIAEGTAAAGGPGAVSASTNSTASIRASRVKYAYQRPIFLQLFTDEEIQATADHLVRPIMTPRDVTILPWFTGYAETINAGKSLRNEDQSSFHKGVLRTSDVELPLLDEIGLDKDDLANCELPYFYFAVFDGHAGSGCAVTAANELHQIVHKKLLSILHHILPRELLIVQRARDEAEQENSSQNNKRAKKCSKPLWFSSRDISPDSLIIGALESAFWEMDKSIGEDKLRYKLLGGCTVVVSVFILGKLYVANAGDSRAVLCRNGDPYPMSFDFTPVSERQRLQQLGYQKPQLLGGEYTHLDYSRRPLSRDLGKMMLVRDAHMTGWAYKEITAEDLKVPVVYGEGKRSRLLSTIGVTRGFGDHDLRAHPAQIKIKPFLTPQPEVRVLDVRGSTDSDSSNIGPGDVLVMATDGLWDVISNEEVALIVENGLKLYEDADDVRLRYKLVTIAQDLVMAARGKLSEYNWRRNDGSAATIDDITVLVIPILPYKVEHEDWLANKKKQGNSSSEQPQHSTNAFNGSTSAATSSKTELSAEASNFMATSEKHLSSDDNDEINLDSLRLEVNSNQDENNSEDNETFEEAAEEAIEDEIERVLNEESENKDETKSSEVSKEEEEKVEDELANSSKPEAEKFKKGRKRNRNQNNKKQEKSD